MANPRPNLENLEKGRGKKPKLGHKSYSVNLAPSNKDRLDQLAQSFDCTYNNRGSISGLLTEIAEGRLIVTPRPSYMPNPMNSLSSSDVLDVLTERIAQEIAQNQSNSTDSLSSDNVLDVLTKRIAEEIEQNQLDSTDSQTKDSSSAKEEATSPH